MSPTGQAGCDRAGRSGRHGQVQPHVRCNVVPRRAAEPPGVGDAEHPLRGVVSLLGRAQIPSHGFGVIPRNAGAALVRATEAILRLGVSPRARGRTGAEALLGARDVVDGDRAPEVVAEVLVDLPAVVPQQ